MKETQWSSTSLRRLTSLLGLLTLLVLAWQSRKDKSIPLTSMTDTEPVTQPAPVTQHKGSSTYRGPDLEFRYNVWYYAGTDVAPDLSRFIKE